jgi:transposase-like protein
VLRYGKSNTKVRRSYTVADKERILQSFQASGQTIKEWCRENEVGLSTLQRWQRTGCQAKLATTAQTWVPVVAIAEKKEPHHHTGWSIQHRGMRPS